MITLNIRCCCSIHVTSSLGRIRRTLTENRTMVRQLDYNCCWICWATILYVICYDNPFNYATNNRLNVLLRDSVILRESRKKCWNPCKIMTNTVKYSGIWNRMRKKLTKCVKLTMSISRWIYVCLKHFHSLRRRRS